MPDVQYSRNLADAIKSATDYILSESFQSALEGYNTWIKRYGKRLTDEETEELFAYFQKAVKTNANIIELLKKVP